MSKRARKARRMGHPARAAARNSPHVAKPAPPSGKRAAARERQRRRQARMGALAAARDRLRGRLLGLLGSGPSVNRELQIGVRAVDRTDLGWSAVTGLAAAALFATALTAHAALGDAPETVAGVKTLGILHAPGYPAYVLVAHAFTLLVPIGGAAFRVNLFSAVCAALTVAGLQLLARRCGAPRWASALGALTVAAMGGFWFYATFAKHDMFSGLLFLIALHLCLSCARAPTVGTLGSLGAAIGVGLGSSWPLMVLLLPTVAFVLLIVRRRLRWRGVIAGSLAGVLAVVALYGFVMVRAEQNPPVNWGDATTLSGLSNLVRRTDFTARLPSVLRGGPSGLGNPAGASPPTGTPLGSGTISSAAVTGGVLGNYAIIFGRELGVLGVLLAAAGLILTLRRRSVAGMILLVTFLVNLVGASAAAGPGSSGYDADLIEVGFILGCLFVLGCWVAVAAGAAVEWLGAATSGGLATRRWPAGLTALASLGLAAGVLVPSVLAHQNVARRASQPLADRYARSIFAQLPPHAAVFFGSAEFTQPLIMRQVLDHERPDVLVVAADSLGIGWYRHELAKRLGRALPPSTGDPVLDAANAIRSLNGVRPEYLDPQTTERLAGHLGSEAVGLLATPVLTSTKDLVGDPATLQRAVMAAERAVGMPDPQWNVWPNSPLERSTYSTAALKVARAYYERHDLAGMRRALLGVLSIEPGNGTARTDLGELGG